MSKVYAYFFPAALVLSVPFITEDELKKQIEKNNTITAVEFWADWNKQNEIKEMQFLKKCDIYRINVSTYPNTQLRYNVKVVPTIIIFEKGEEKKRFEGNLMFKMCPETFSIKKVQKSIDKLLYSKFE
jgi:thiol-disulfide isomerase/thioredoxin